MAMAALCAAATDRFYIEDFSISAGETRTVSIMLDNETAYTAFQTDIYLPEGLILEQEDGDYIFDLTSRKGRDHNIASQVQADGAIRIMSYSPSIKTYSGNSGALVTFNVTATGNLGGPTTIKLKNTLFTTTSGTEIAFNDEVCNVSIPSDRFEVDGIYYHKTSSNTVEVTYGDSVQYYSGDITIPNTINYEGIEYTVTAIGDSAFYRNNDLNTVIIPETVESIGNFAFKRCRWLSKVTCLATTPPTLGEQCFEDYAVDFLSSEQKSYSDPGGYEVLNYPYTIPYDEDESYDEDDWGLAPRAMLYVPRDQYSDYVNSVWDSYFMIIVIIGNGKTAEPTIEVHEEYICGFHTGTSFTINSEEGQVYYCETEQHMYDYYLGWRSYGGGIIPSHNYGFWSLDYGISLYAFAIAPGKEPSEVVGADGGWIEVLHYIDERDITLRSYHLESDNIYYSFDYFENYDEDESTNNTLMTDDSSSNNRDYVYDNIYNYVYSQYFDDDDYYFVYPADEYIDDNDPLGVSCGINYYFTVDMYINGYDGNGYDDYKYVYDIIDESIDYCYYQGDICIPDSVEYNGVLHEVTSINYGAFHDCEQLTSVSIPRTVSCIYDNAFAGCSNLASITCLATTPPRVYSSTFAEHYNTATLYVPYDAVEAYKSADYWKEFVHIVGIGNAGAGDVDCDGKVSIADVTAIIDYLLSGNAQSINEENADVDHDGAITISDVTALIDYLLSGNWPEEPEPTPVITSYTVNGVTFNMVEVEGGTFQMGATPEQGENANDNEKPVHQVTLSGFNIGQTEVTQELWQAVMGTNPSKFNDNVNKPVETISWEDCQTFIARLNELTGQNFRLPTEAEWEFAARGGMKSQGYKYSGSDDLNEIAWYNYNAYAVGSSSPDYGTHSVSTKAANELGLYDMTGNVWEWCQDWSGDYSDADQINPTGPEMGTNRVIRGGGWTNYPSLLRVAARTGYKPGFIGNFIGFRLAL